MIIILEPSICVGLVCIYLTVRNDSMLYVASERSPSIIHVFTFNPERTRRFTQHITSIYCIIVVFEEIEQIVPLEESDEAVRCRQDVEGDDIHPTI